MLYKALKYLLTNVIVFTKRVGQGKLPGHFQVLLIRLNFSLFNQNTLGTNAEGGKSPKDSYGGGMFCRLYYHLFYWLLIVYYISSCKTT